MRGAPEKIMISGEDPSEALYFVAAKKDKTKNIMIARLLLICTAIIVICTKLEFPYQCLFRKYVKNIQK